MAMCGFVGGNNFGWSYERGIESLRHRGPDSQKLVNFSGVTLGFARLSVIDPSHAADQPMTSQDQAVAIVFNGEIYDYKTLRGEIAKEFKYEFLTNSDTEVLLAAYLHWGDRWVDHVDGMFAVAVVDQRQQKIKLFRDRVGIKPLYYFYDGRNFAFASELNALVQCCNSINFEIDYSALYDFLTYRYIPAPKTAYRCAYKLLPSHWLCFDIRTNQIDNIRKHWSLNPLVSCDNISNTDAAHHLGDLIDAAVKSQLVADVPVGCFLSGGVDSSAIVSSASLQCKRLKTFSIGFDVPSHSETRIAKSVSEMFCTEHYEEILTASEAGALVKMLPNWYGEPFGDTSAIPTYLVAKLARQHVTVVLTGDGGDEIFGGYRWYRIFKQCTQTKGLRRLPLEHVFRFLKARFRKQSLTHRVFNGLEGVFSDDLTLYAKLLRGLVGSDKTVYAARWGIPSDYDDLWYFRQYWREDLPILTRLQYLDFHTYLPDDILTKVDRVTMAVSLEARVPLLSQAIVEFMFSLPEVQRFLCGQLKGLFKRSLQGRLPPAILGRHKKGFSIPPAYYESTELTEHEEVLKNVYGLM